MAFSSLFPGRIFSIFRMRSQKAFASSLSINTRRSASGLPRAFVVAFSVAPLVALTTIDDHKQTWCNSADEHDIPAAVHDRSSAEKVLTRNFIADAASVIAPSVVNIVASSHGFIPMAQAGSGFIISEDGYVATNAHVVSSVKVGGLVDVTLFDMRKLVGRVHSMDKQTDIAIIKLEGDASGKLPVAKLGSSAKLRAGEFVVAVGSPLQLQDSVTFGIVSAPARHSSELGMAKMGTDYIQTDAAINVGNSGGPLVNLDGEVIGINCMKAQGYDGVSFAIPIDTAWRVISQLMKNRRVVRPYVGLRMINFVESGDQIGRGRRHSSRLPNESTSVLVVDVTQGSPADLAGLQSGDIIVSIDDKPVRQTKDMLDAIGMDIGKQHTLKVLKGDRGAGEREERTLSLVTAGDRSHGRETPGHQHGPSPRRHF